MRPHPPPAPGRRRGRRSRPSGGLDVDDGPRLALRAACRLLAPGFGLQAWPVRHDFVGAGLVPARRRAVGGAGRSRRFSTGGSALRSSTGPGASLTSRSAGRESILAAPRFPVSLHRLALSALDRPHALRQGNRGTALVAFPPTGRAACYEGSFATHPVPVASSEGADHVPDRRGVTSQGQALCLPIGALCLPVPASIPCNFLHRNSLPRPPGGMTMRPAGAK
jgi:hypothetical protein